MGVSQNGKLVISLPGPPLGAFSIMDWGLRPLIYHAFGINAPKRLVVEAVLQDDVYRPPFPYQFTFRMQVKEERGRYVAFSLINARTAESSIRCNALGVVPPNVEVWHKGDVIKATLLYDLV